MTIKVGLFTLLAAGLWSGLSGYISQRTPAPEKSSMHFYAHLAHVTAVRQLRGEKLLILSNSLQKIDSSHQLPWRTKWMTLIKKHKRNVVLTCEQS